MGCFPRHQRHRTIAFLPTFSPCMCSYCLCGLLACEAVPHSPVFQHSEKANPPRRRRSSRRSRRKKSPAISPAAGGDAQPLRRVIPHFWRRREPARRARPSYADAHAARRRLRITGPDPSRPAGRRKGAADRNTPPLPPSAAAKPTVRAVARSH